MDGYTFYTLPSSANGRHFSPATLPSDEAPVNAGANIRQLAGVKMRQVTS